MEQDQLWQVLRRAWLLILVFLVLGLAASLAYVRSTPPAYTARADVYVSIVGTKTVSELGSASTFSVQQARNFALLADRELVVDPVVNQLKLPQTATQLAGSISATVPANTAIISIEVTQPTPNDAATIANAVAGSLAKTAAALLPPAAKGAPAIRLQTVQRAEPPGSPSSPNVLTSTLMGLAAGLVAGVAVAFVVDGMRRSARETATTAQQAKPPRAVKSPPRTAQASIPSGPR